MEGKGLWEKVKHLKLDFFWLGLIVIIMLFILFFLNDRQITILAQSATIECPPCRIDLRFIRPDNRLLSVLDNICGWGDCPEGIMRRILINIIAQSLIISIMILITSCWMIITNIGYRRLFSICTLLISLVFIIESIEMINFVLKFIFSIPF